MVCNHGNLSGDDHIQGGGWSLVSSDVCCALDRQGLGVDRRWKSGDSRTAATCKSTIVPYSTIYLSGSFDTVRRLVDVIYGQYCHPAGAAKHDGHVSLRIRHSYELVLLDGLPIRHIFDRGEGGEEADS